MTKSKPGKQRRQKQAARAPAAAAPRQGSEQRGAAGGSAMGGLDTGGRAGDAGQADEAELQQSAQREGMGSHRHGGRGNEQALDAAADVDALGNRVRGAANAREPGNKG